jgi:outer membrane protein OmpA-like peptidoglycan-associated protein
MRSANLRALVAVGALVVFLCVGAGTAYAACDVTYTGSPGGAWNVPGNWSTNALPTTVQNACIPPGDSSVHVPAASTAHARTLSAQSDVRIVGTGELALADTATGDVSALVGLDLEAGARLSTGGSSLTLDGTVAIDGQIPLGNFSTLIRLVGGTLTGNGSIGPSFNNFGGTVQPGAHGAVGTLSFGNGYAQQGAGTLDVDLASAASFDTLQVTGDAAINGIVHVERLGGYAPRLGDTWQFVHAAGFLDVGLTTDPSSFAVDTGGGGAMLRYAPLPAGPKPPVLSATAGDAQATATIGAPADPGTGAIQGYDLTVQPGNVHRHLNAPGELAIGGLQNGTTYTLTATVTTTVATSAPSAPVQVTPSVPAPPPPAPPIDVIPPPATPGPEPIPPGGTGTPPPAPPAAPGPAIVPEPKGTLIVETLAGARRALKKIKAPAKKTRLVCRKGTKKTTATGRQGCRSVPVTATITLRLAADFTFGLDSSTLSKDGRAALAKLGARLRIVKVLSARIAGNASYEGQPQLDGYNKTLSGRRAASVAGALRKSLGHAKLALVANGVTKPVETNATAAGRAANRNVQLTLVISRR